MNSQPRSIHNDPTDIVVAHSVAKPESISARQIQRLSTTNSERISDATTGEILSDKLLQKTKSTLAIVDSQMTFQNSTQLNSDTHVPSTYRLAPKLMPPTAPGSNTSSTGKGAVATATGFDVKLNTPRLVVTLVERVLAA